ncbi:GDP-mannose-dependent alpha-(1-2)-phosphatidylinositol mannosyltransferase [Burkholderia sp. AD24]|nr:GDP-mannose-dependent alpha-(1-2)-phosphatidylinositol mannosyltransferase [Burkholderia sp. AD24]
MSNSKLKNIKISVVCPWFLRGDAVGHSAHDYYRALREAGFTNVRGLGVRNDFPDMDFEVCEDAKSLEDNHWFKQSDLIVYHFAIHHELFDALGNPEKSGKHVVCFHNVTPKHLTPRRIWDVIDRSFAQIALFRHAHTIWVDSRENAEELTRQGIENLPVVELPIAVDRPAIGALEDKPRRQVDLMCVGRFFPSKGIVDIIDALAVVKKKTDRHFVLRLVGNTDFSEPDYVREVKERVRLCGLGEHVDFIGKVDEATLARVFRQSHVLVSGSYHEGFCVPVIEGLRAGMIPVTYDAGNLRWIAGGRGRIVPTGSVGGLAQTLIEVIEGVAESFENAGAAVLPLDGGMKSARQFSEEAKAYASSFSFDNFTGRLERAVTRVFTENL